MKIIRRGLFWLPASFFLLAVYLTIATNWVQWRNGVHAKIEAAPRLLGYALALIALWVVVIFLGMALRQLSRWGRTKRLTTPDFLAGWICVLAFVGSRVSGYGSPALGLAVIFLALLLTRVLILTREVCANEPIKLDPQDKSALDAFEAVLGKHGFGPLDSIDPKEDGLSRMPLIRTLVPSLIQKRERSLVFGLEGPWGIGKTTVLNELQTQLRSHGVLVARFDAWSFREPSRIVEGYFSTIQQLISDYNIAPRIRTIFGRLSLGLGALSESHKFRFLKFFETFLNIDQVDAVREDLRDALKQIDKPIVILIDDLDRLDLEEIRAAFRAIRAISELPCLTNVIAYDRARLVQRAFSGNEGPELARDYLAKIVNVELNLSLPSRELLFRNLEQSLQPALSKLDEAERKVFVQQIGSDPFGVFIKALPTPREIKRVAVTTVWLWERMRKELNLFDLFTITVIKFRFPDVHAFILSRPELFFEAAWSNWIYFADKKDRERARQRYADELKDADPANFEIIRRLIELILPLTSTDVTRQQGRKQRRIRHPSIFPRYFQLTYKAGDFPELEIEVMAENVLATPDIGKKKKLISDVLERAVRNETIWSFFDQRDLLFEELAGKEKSPKDDDLKALIQSVTERSADFLYNRDYLTNLCEHAVATVSVAVSKLGSDDIANAVVLEAIKGAPNLIYAASLVLNGQGKATPKPFGERQVNVSNLEDEFVKRILHRFKDGGLLDAEPTLIASAIFWVNPRPEIINLVYAELRSKPAHLAKIASFYLSLSLDGPAGLHIFRNDLTLLPKHFDLKTLNQITEGLSLDSLPNEYDRVCVRLFREFVGLQAPST